MKKIALIMGSIEIILGLLCLIATSVIAQVIPKMARIGFMFNSGNFTEADYVLSFSYANGVAVGLCLLGAATIVYFAFIQKERD